MPVAALSTGPLPPPASNPPLSRLLRAVTAVEVLVLLVAGGGLLFLPGFLRPVWPWALPPFNAAYLGAVYLASLTAAALVVWDGRWSPARVVVPMILLFTVAVLAVSLAHLEVFDLRSAATGLWFLLYAGIPANAAYWLWRVRRLPPASAARPGRAWRVALRAQVVTLGVYAVALLVAPGPAAAFWPWPVDVFHARMYSAAYGAPALGALLLLRAAAPAEVRALGLAQAVLGGLTVAGLFAVDGALHRVDWAAGGTWLWVGAHAGLALSGAALAASGRPRRPALSLPLAALRHRARRLLSPQPLATLLGWAFVAAGAAGFLPALTPAPPGGAPHLAVHAGYGYLLGLFPVNAVHNLFHLAVGGIALLASRRPPAARRFVRAFAVLLGLLTVLGALPATSTLLGLAPLFGHDVWLHGAEAGVAWYAGSTHPEETVAAGRVSRLSPPAASRRGHQLSSCPAWIES